MREHQNQSISVYLVCKRLNEFMLFSSLLCSMLIYHRYINADIGPWLMGTWQKDLAQLAGTVEYTDCTSAER